MQIKANRVSPILYWIHSIRRITWIQLEPVIHDWRLLNTFLSLSSTHSWLFSVLVIIPDWWSVGCEFKRHRNLFELIFCHLISWNSSIICFKIGKIQMEVRICMQFYQNLWALRLELSGGPSTLMNLEVKPSVRNHTQNPKLYSESYSAFSCRKLCKSK